MVVCILCNRGRNDFRAWALDHGQSIFLACLLARGHIGVIDY